MKALFILLALLLVGIIPIVSADAARTVTVVRGNTSVEGYRGGGSAGGFGTVKTRKHVSRRSDDSCDAPARVRTAVRSR